MNYTESSSAQFRQAISLLDRAIREQGPIPAVVLEDGLVTAVQLRFHSDVMEVTQPSVYGLPHFFVSQRGTFLDLEKKRPISDKDRISAEAYLLYDPRVIGDAIVGGRSPAESEWGELVCRTEYIPVPSLREGGLAETFMMRYQLEEDGQFWAIVWETGVPRPYSLRFDQALIENLVHS